MHATIRTSNPGRKAIINPGISWATKPAPDWTIAVADRLVSEWTHLGPALHAAAVAVDAARAARDTIEPIYNGPAFAGWHFKAGPSDPLRLLRTGWHAVGPRAPHATIKEIVEGLATAEATYSETVQPLWTACLEAGLSQHVTRFTAVTPSDVVHRVITAHGTAASPG